MEIIYLIIGLALGAIVAYLYVSARTSALLNNQIEQHPITKQNKETIDTLQQQLAEERNKTSSAEKEVATVNQKLFAQEEKLANQVGELEQLKAQFKLEFENLAQRIFDEKSSKFKEQNKEQLESVLKPLGEKLKDFETKVEKVYKEESNERITLKVEINKLFEMNSKLSADANNLATALKGSNKHQGNWGEMILEKILERSGLRSGIEFETQVTDTNANGEKIMPDVVVHLPESKHIIIDSKVSLVAYTNLVSTENEEEKKLYAKAHADSIRAHIKLLSDKQYFTAQKLVTPDFVLLFMPIEAAFSAAMQTDSELYNYAWDRQVVLVSPTTLLAMLRTIASIWHQEKRTRNAEEIAKAAGDLYEKFVGFTGDLLDLGKKLKEAKDKYDDSMKKLSEGNGNLIKRAENMKKLGAKTQKSIDPRLIERSGSEEQTVITE